MINFKKLTITLLFSYYAIGFYNTAQPMKFLERLRSGSKESSQQDPLQKKMDNFATAQQNLKFAREKAEAEGKTSSSSVGRAVYNLDKASKDLRSAINKASDRGELTQQHINDLESIRSKVENKEERRINEGRAKPLTREEQKTLETLKQVTKSNRQEEVSTQGKEAFIGFSDKQDPVSAPSPNAPTSLQKRLNNVQDFQAVQDARKDFEAAKQKSLDFSADVEAARKKAQETQNADDRARYNQLSDQLQNLNKAMMNKQNALLIEVEAAEKSVRSKVESPSPERQKSQSWTKIIQTDSDKAPSNITIGKKDFDTPPALPSRTSVFKKETSTQFATETQKKLTISEPQTVLTKSQIPIFEKGLKDAQKDWRLAEKDADTTRNAHLSYIAKVEKKYPDEAVLINQRDFEKSRIDEIQKNLQSDTAKTKANLEQQLKKADTQEFEDLSKRLLLVNKQIETQQQEINDRQKKLNNYEEKIKNIDSKILSEFKEIDRLGALRKEAETTKTNLGLEVQTIQRLLSEARNPEKQDSSPVPVTKESSGGRTGVALPPQSADEKQYSDEQKEIRRQARQENRTSQETFTTTDK